MSNITEGDINEAKKAGFILTQAQTADRSGLAQSHISMILRGDRQPTIESSEKLEAATGVCREAWLWPDRHWNPYVPFMSKPNTCLGCANRKGRVKWLVDRCMALVDNAENKIESEQTCLNVFKTMGGYDDNVAYGLRRWENDEFVLVAHTAPYKFKPVMHRSEMPNFAKYLDKDEPILVHSVFQMPEDWPERKQMIEYGITSLLGVSYEGCAFGMMTFNGHIAKWTDGMVGIATDLIQCFHRNRVERLAKESGKV